MAAQGFLPIRSGFFLLVIDLIWYDPRHATDLDAHLASFHRAWAWARVDA